MGGDEEPACEIELEKIDEPADGVIGERGREEEAGGRGRRLLEERRRLGVAMSLIIDGGNLWWPVGLF
jgi:hypothetical protein